MSIRRSTTYTEICSSKQVLTFEEFAILCPKVQDSSIKTSEIVEYQERLSPPLASYVSIFGKIRFIVRKVFDHRNGVYVD